MGDPFRRARLAAVPVVAVVLLVGLGTVVPVAAEEPSTAPEAPVEALELPTDRIIVQYADAHTEAVQERVVEQVAETAGVPEAADPEVLGTTVAGASVVELDEEMPLGQVEELTQRLAADPAVVRAEPDFRVVSYGLPNDRRFGEQWSLPIVQAPAGWSAATGKGAVIGVIDTGITDHRDLSPKVAGGYDFIHGPYFSNDGDGRDADYRDPGTYGSAVTCGTGYDIWSSWHGTSVAGIAGAVTNNQVDVAGVAPDAQLLIGRVLGACGGGHISEVADAIAWMSGVPVPGVPDNPNPADVVNLSLGQQREGCSYFYQVAIDAAVARGTVVVAAAGNSNADASGSTPGNCEHVITVGATGTNGLPTSYSNHGPAVDLSAPGERILSTSDTGNTYPLGGNVYRFDGTSAAAPHVAGVVALLREQDPALTPAQIEQRLVETATPFPGGRRLNIAAALGVEPSPFTDLVQIQEHYQDMVWLHATGIATGWAEADGTRTYRPASPVARDAMAAFLYRLAGSPGFEAPPVSPFRDVHPGQEHYKEIAWLHAQGIATGWDNGDGTRSYRPTAAVARDAMAAFLYRYAGSPEVEKPADAPFTDVHLKQLHAKEMTWLHRSGIATGWDNGDGTSSYRPLAPVARDAMAAFLHRLDQTPS